MMNDYDDDGGGRGLSGWAGYMLGRMAADADHQHMERMRQRFARPRRVPYDADAVESAIESWKDAVRGRDHTIARLKAQLKDGSANYEALREENSRLRDQLAMHVHETEIMKNGVVQFTREQDDKIARLKRDIALMQTLHQQHDEKVARLEAEIARLKGDV